MNRDLILIIDKKAEEEEEMNLYANDEFYETAPLNKINVIYLYEGEKREITIETYKALTEDEIKDIIIKEHS